jgi:hypothetical protein
METEMMIDLRKRLSEKETKKGSLSPSTIDNYMSVVLNLNDKKPFNNLAFLKKTDIIMPKITAYAESTQKTLLATLCSVLGLYKDNSTYKRAFNFYTTKMNGAVAKAEDTSEANDKQKENWLTWDEVLKRLGEIKPDPDSGWSPRLHYMVLALYSLAPPRRNQDYICMSVYKATKKDKIDDLPKNKNYLIVSGGVPKQFIFNIYKTAKAYGQQQLNLSPEMVVAMTMYLEKHPLNVKKTKEFPLLVDDKGEAITKDNAITRILNRIFGKKVGSSMLRHIYLSSKYNIADMKDDATAMGHSLEEQKQYMKVLPTTQPTPPPT